MIRYASLRHASAALLAILCAFPGLGEADDCVWDKQQLSNYLENCKFFDGCASRDRMLAIVRQACGTTDQGTDQATQLPRKSNRQQSSRAIQQRQAASEAPLCRDGDLQVAQAAMSGAKSGLDRAIAAVDAPSAQTLDRLATWLGVRSSADSQTVRNRLAASRVLSDGVVFLCSVNTNIKRGDVYAYVRPDKSFAVVLGAFFFSAPDTGFNSKLGVLVHELTHFALIGATRDAVYGTVRSKALASSNPVAARNNADNYEYFVEATAFGL